MKKIIFLPIMALLIFTICLYGVFPMLFEVKVLKSALALEVSDLAQKKAYFTNLQAISQEVEQNQDFLQTIAIALPEELSVPSLMSFFQTACSENGVILDGFSYEEQAAQQEERAQEAVKQAYFNFNIKGGIASFFSFLKTLENSSRILDVGSISFQVKDEGERTKEAASSGLNFNIRVKTHSY